MTDEQIPVPQLMRVYMTEKPRVWGIFHFGNALPHGNAKRWRGFGGVIMHVGPCKCGNPAHKFPEYYSMAPCLYVNVFGKFASVRIPWMVLDAIQWVTGAS